MLQRWTRSFVTLVTVLTASISTLSAQNEPDRKKTYVEAVAQGAGWMDWQSKTVSKDEQEFRLWIEKRKDEMLANRIPIEHPVLLTGEDFERAKHKIKTTDWAAQWYKSLKAHADFLINQQDDYIVKMIPSLTPTNPYGATCPNCIGIKSQEAQAHGLLKWDYRHPDILTCTKCGQVYPDEKYPETAILRCPRADQELSFYLNDLERAHPEDRTGKYTWHWVGRPIHVSFTGIIREYKINFMATAVRTLAITYRMTDDVRYAVMAKNILLRFATCYRHWMYHDYWDTFADCDPMFAAWHDRNLPLEFKRHLCTGAYRKDSVDKAAMLQSYWGAGRIHPSTDSISHLTSLASAYDMVFDAQNDKGQPLWSQAERDTVERDLILEYIFGAEPYVGGADQATCVNNKAPRVYAAMATVARTLGVAVMADTALRGYEGVRDESFLFDGFSGESPAYTNMFLHDLTKIPEQLHGFRWPAGFAARTGTVDLYRNDEKLQLMFRAMIDHLRSDGRYPPLSDSFVTGKPSSNLFMIGACRYPKYYDGLLATLYPSSTHGEYVAFHLTNNQIQKKRDFNPPEIYFPAWMVALLRHGRAPNETLLAMSFSPPGNHRHSDNLGLFYCDSGQTVLGDHGYLHDMPGNKWVHATASHNLVIVDDEEQRHKGDGQTEGRHPKLHRMISSPGLSVVEASSTAYPQCSQYQRLIALVKGPDARTFAVDIFRIKGGFQRHTYRLFSELASSDVSEGSLTFKGLDMPKEPPMPNFGTSLEHDHIYGLRDARGVNNPPAAWQAVWSNPDRSYRLWMLSQTDRVEAANGPGQETQTQIGRRVRYLDVIRQANEIESTFVAVHEPSGPNHQMAIHDAKRLAVPTAAGPDAVALCIESDWGRYLILSEFTGVAEIEGVRFQGDFGVYCQTPNDSQWLLTSGATILKKGNFGFADTTPTWTGKIVQHTDYSLTADTPAPADWPALPSEVTTHVLVDADGFDTGLPVQRIENSTIDIKRFPLPSGTHFQLDSVRFMEN